MEWKYCACGKKLFRADLRGESVVEIKCWGCGLVQTFGIVSEPVLIPDGAGGFVERRPVGV